MLPLLWFCASGALNTVLALCVGLSGERAGPGLPRVRLGRVLSAALAVLAATVLEGALGWAWVLEPAGLIQLLWIDLMVVAPVAGFVLLAVHGRELTASAPARALALGTLALVPFGLYARWVEPFDLAIERHHVTLSGQVAGRLPLRLGVLADLEVDQVRPFEQEAVERLMAERPDVILVPGDVFQRGLTARTAPVAELRALFDRLWAPGGVWVVPGDADEVPLLAEVVRGTHARLLVDEVVTLRVRDRRVSLLGLGESAGSLERLAAFDALPEGDDLRLVLSHMPRAVLALRPSSRIDLLVAGHTHGGQVVLPLLGPPWLPSPLPRHVAAGGLHEVNGNGLYISRGVGVQRGQSPPIRFRCRPEVSLLTLQ